MKKLYLILFCLLLPSALHNCVKAKNDPADLNETIIFAEQVDDQTQFERGLMYYWGRGTPQNNKEALKWFRRAAERGNSDAQYALGGMYYLGDGIQQDYVLAHMWFELAAAQGDDKAREIRDIIAEKMSPAQLEQAQELAREQTVEQDDVK